MIDSGNTIHLIPLSLDDDIDLVILKKAVAKQFKMELQLKEVHIDLSSFFNPDRVQYSANEILTALLDSANGSDDKLISITGVDIFIPVLTFIFGQAYLGGQAGIVSVYRLKNEFYGMRGNDELFRDRMVKTLIHEIGHMFGLKHCVEIDCVMRSVTYVEEIDQKSENLCPKCHKLITS